MFNETVNLGVLDGGEIVYIEIMESNQSLRLPTRIGKRSAVHALGKAIMACSSEEDLLQWLALHRMVKLTEGTVTDPEAFLLALKQVRQYGYTIRQQRRRCGGRAPRGCPVRRARLLRPSVFPGLPNAFSPAGR